MNKLKYRLTALLYLVLLHLPVQQLQAADFAVSPMLIEINSEQRAVEEFTFSIFGRSNANLKLELFDMSQQQTGYMGFVRAEVENAESMANWIELQDSRLRIRDGETVDVRGRINVPARAAGTHLVGVMVEEDIPEDEQQGISVKVRYAVVLSVRIDASRNRRIKSSFEELVVVEKEDGTYLQGRFSNESATDEWLVSQVQVRNLENRLVERVEMKTESAWQRQDPASRVFPGSSVLVYGKLSDEVASGDYNVLVRNRFADKSQPVYRDQIRLQAGAGASQEPAADAPAVAVAVASPLEVSPPALAVEIRSNGTSFSSFFIANNSDQEVSVELPSELAGIESQGISDFQFYPDSMVIRPRQRTRVVLKQTHLEDAEYGNIVFQARIDAAGLADHQRQLDIATLAGS